MPASYMTLWSQDRIRQIKKYRQEGAGLEILFGGPHSSEPSFKRYGVREGDFIYPVRVQQGILYVIGRMQVRQIISLEEYIEGNPALFAGCRKSQWPSLIFEEYLSQHPEMRYLAPTCTEEVALGEGGTPIRLDIDIPPEMLERLRFRSRKRERSLKHIENGRLKRAIGLQGGVYRLAETSASEIEALLLNHSEADS